MGKAIIDPTLDGWRFYLEEVSNGVFRVDGKHTDGRTVSRTGPQHEVLKRSIEDVRDLSEKSAPEAVRRKLRPPASFLHPFAASINALAFGDCSWRQHAAADLKGFSEIDVQPFQVVQPEADANSLTRRPALWRARRFYLDACLLENLVLGGSSAPAVER